MAPQPTLYHQATRPCGPQGILIAAPASLLLWMLIGAIIF